MGFTADLVMEIVEKPRTMRQREKITVEGLLILLLLLLRFNFAPFVSLLLLLIKQFVHFIFIISIVCYLINSNNDVLGHTSHNE